MGMSAMTTKIYIGYDKRQPVAYNVCRASIERRASRPVDIQPLVLDWMPVKRRGLTDFSFSRYLVPYLCGYKGRAIFMDPDMIVLDDIHKLIDAAPPGYSVSVVKGGQRFEWSSLMVFDNQYCEHLTPELVETGNPQKFDWAHRVGELPKDWNHCVGYDEPTPNAKLVHFTMGIPIWPETAKCEYSKEWHKEAAMSMGTVSFQELMGQSVHVPHLSKLNTLSAEKQCLHPT
jgi:lipopolysaccharide biosynthesis glycosyltransferase